jgi:hypothetical protein
MLRALVLCSALLVAPSAASAADPAPIDEIIVYGDHFARWDHTRWLVTSELVLPLPLTLGSDNNTAFLSYALQTRMVLLCDKDGKLTKKRIEVMCTIEDIGLQATSVRHHRRERDRAIADEVLSQIDAKLTGAKVQLQVDFKGGVNNIDLEGLVARNERQREVNENLRQLLLRMVAGFHLKIPDHAQRAGQWIEYNSSLMSMPSLTASRGSTTMVHTVSRHPGYQLVQTLGQGTTATKLPNFDADRPDFGSDLDITTYTDGATPDAPTMGPVQLGDGTGKELDIEVTYTFDTTGVAVFDRETGIMTERVWVTRGAPTASSAGGTFNNPFRNVGRIQMLGKTDQPDVGPTRQVGWPGQQMPPLPEWTDLEVAPER